MAKVNVPSSLSINNFKKTLMSNVNSMIRFDYESSSFYNDLQKAITKRSLHMKLPASMPEPHCRVLAICCYMADRRNLVEELVESIKESKSAHIDFVVTNNSNGHASPLVEPFVKYNLAKASKFNAVSKIITEQIRDYHDFILIIDDDVSLPQGFFDRFFKVVEGFKLMLSQPAMTKDSFFTWPCSIQIRNAIAHLVSFVEIGPVTCIHKKLLPLLPFESNSPMGWGLDYSWAYICRHKRWPMGVVDLAPVQHNIRGVAEHYRAQKELVLMNKYLSKNRHVPLCATEVIGQIIPMDAYNPL
jgi:hypothetical protein